MYSDIFIREIAKQDYDLSANGILIRQEHFHLQTDIIEIYSSTPYYPIVHIYDHGFYRIQHDKIFNLWNDNDYTKFINFVTEHSDIMIKNSILLRVL